jgi:hypothetical protein
LGPAVCCSCNPCSKKNEWRDHLWPSKSLSKKWDRFHKGSTKPWMILDTCPYTKPILATQAILLPPAHERLRSSIPHDEQGHNSVSQLFWNKLIQNYIICFVI